MPFLEAHELEAGYSLLLTGKWRFVFSALEYEYPIQRAFAIRTNGKVKMFDEEKFHARTQDLERSYHDADKFYWGTTSAWLSETNMFSSFSTAIIIPPNKTVSIDTKEDWIRAEQIYNNMRITSRENAKKSDTTLPSDPDLA